MAITQEQFDALVKKLEAFSKKHPGRYRLRVALLAALGYAYLFLVLLGLLALVGLVIFFIVVSHYVNVNIYILKFGVLLAIPAWVIARSLWVVVPPPEGLKLSRHQAPPLFALVDEVTTALQAPKFHNILLNQEFNAAVVQIPRLGIFGWQENYLLLGLPLLQSLSLGQFKAILAHELGHLSGNHSRFAAWIYRIRKTWLQIYERLHQNDQHGAEVLFNRFLNWYWPAFNAYSFTLARMDEYEADRCAAQLAGAHTAAEALINVAVKARFLEDSFWSHIHQQVEHQADPPADVYSSMLTVLRRPLAEDLNQQWLEQALARTTNNADTHPCLTDRLKSLGYSAIQAYTLAQPATLQSSAAEQLLGKALQQFAEQFNRDWKEATSTPWRQRYAYLQETQGKLQALEQNALVKALTGEEIWEQAYYTSELRGQEAALPLLQKVLAIQPDHAEANYTLGQILLQQQDEAGIAYIEKGIAQRIHWVIDGCELVYGFYWQQGQAEEAQKYRDRAEQHYQLLLKAQQERAIVTDQDSFQPHTLTAYALKVLQQQLSNYVQIKEAYLVEKVVTYFPEEHICVLGIVRKKGLIGGGEADQKLVDLLVKNLEFPIQGYVVILNHSASGKLRKKMRQVDRSLIF
ncbi:M48 family metallopeptidase [Stenomitos frigidus]|uniref:Peptidase n=1 Tax=Stenomitos frigidus ULC18 TaxID=2107698 RepID=A0A2T1DYV5_9CYAN|nr:M48 family metallopeptidase [Stenomitos frigidus]PSB25687.1 peptidase [Stenomitos frigidus ULC18]